MDEHPRPTEGEPVDADVADVTDEQEQERRMEAIRADARAARTRTAERDETVAFVRELGFGELLED